MPSAMQFDADTQRAPRAALRFRVPVEFAKGDAESRESPITMLARSSKPIEHWFFGKVAHDLSGMQLRKESIPLDYCHDPAQIVGVASEFAVKPDGLHVTGKLVSAFAGDRVDEITKLAAAGVPYEASIDFYGPMKLERVRENESAKVNGQQFDGPGVIVRQWILNAVAVCPLGADQNTRSQFAAGEPDDVEISFSNEGTAMAKANDTTKETDAPADAAQLATPQIPSTATAEDPVKLFAWTLAQFVAHFGEVNGSKWAAAGKTYEEALKLHADELEAKLKAANESKDAEIESLKAKLAAIDTGEETSLSSSSGDEGAAKSKHAKDGSNRAKFTANIRMPSLNGSR